MTNVTSPSIKDLQDQIVSLKSTIQELRSEKAPKPGFFAEDNGTKSSMRLMCFTSLIAAIVFGTLTINISSMKSDKDAVRPDTSTGIYITFSFLLGAFAPKALQKFAEQPAFGEKKSQ